jgi:dTDP-4-dehydrorhamnose 3,5-epimerase
MPFSFIKLNIPDVILVEPASYIDSRGYFLEMFKSSSFSENGIDLKFSQDNLSFSKKGTVRGLHFQKHPYEQGKLVSTITGSIFDVAVDLRINSNTFGKYVYAILSEENHRSLWIPPGFGHGFMALEDSHVMYKVTSEYNKDYDSGIMWNDPDIGVLWPDIAPIISDKDRKLITLNHYKKEIGMIRA